jgi:hypothetical protein
LNQAASVAILPSALVCGAIFPLVPVLEAHLRRPDEPQGIFHLCLAYTDDTGTKEYDLKLSGRRARAVRDSLVQAGIDPSLISTKGFGKSDPRVRGNSSKARAANRREEIGIVDSTLQATRGSSKNVSR